MCRKFNYQQPTITKNNKVLVAATLDVYDSVQKQLLPTPQKSHYTFNLRDVSKVFQGISKVGAALEDGAMLTRLWVHEVFRVFFDRLVSEEDRLFALHVLGELTEKHFKAPLAKVLGVDKADDASLVSGLRSLVFGDFMVPGADPKVYTEIKDHSKLMQVGAAACSSRACLLSGLARGLACCCGVVLACDLLVHCREMRRGSC
jgi:dynein heavy chain, axonemal